MITLTELWLPILLSAVFVFIASSILHMVIPIHKGDYRKLPGEEKIQDAIRAQGPSVGTYMFPCADSMKDCGSPEMIEKFKRGPVGIMTVLPSGAPAIGKNLIQWFVYTLVVGLFVAYAALLGFPRGAEFMPVFRLAGTVALAAYALSPVPESIWKGQLWSTTGKFIFDGVVYGLITGATFAWLWPAVA